MYILKRTKKWIDGDKACAERVKELNAIKERPAIKEGPCQAGSQTW